MVQPGVSVSIISVRVLSGSLSPILIAMRIPPGDSSLEWFEGKTANPLETRGRCPVRQGPLSSPEHPRRLHDGAELGLGHGRARDRAVREGCETAVGGEEHPLGAERLHSAPRSRGDLLDRLDAIE